jgi:hypothetical protein
MLKKRDVNDDAGDDDEVRTSGSQNCATATVSTEEFFLRTQYTLYSSSLISAESVGGGQEIHSQRNTFFFFSFICLLPFTINYTISLYMITGHSLNYNDDLH